MGATRDRGDRSGAASVWLPDAVEVRKGATRVASDKALAIDADNVVEFLVVRDCCEVIVLIAARAVVAGGVFLNALGVGASRLGLGDCRPERSDPFGRFAVKSIAVERDDE